MVGWLVGRLESSLPLLMFLVLGTDYVNVAFSSDGLCEKGRDWLALLVFFWGYGVVWGWGGWGGGCSLGREG